MKTSLKLIGALLVTLTVALSSREAHALGPVGIEVGLRVGDGTNPGNNSSANPLGVGLGGRAGITLFNIYAGLDIMDYLGSGDGQGGIYHAMQYGGTVGYGIGISVLTLRPQLGLGNISFSGSLDQAQYPNSSSFYLEPGVLAMITIGWFFFGADVNALFITSEPAYGSGGNINTNTNWPVSLTIHGQLGVSF